jgi:hypothetical protein
VTWDLTHPPPPTEADEDDEDGVVAPDTILPELEYPTEPKGPFVRPGTYTVTLRAGDATATEPVEVRGDPAIGLTAQQWRARESFLVDLLDAQRAVFRAAQRADALHERLEARRENAGGEASDDLQALVDSAEGHSDALTDLRYDLYGLASVFNWSGVTQPSLRAPTATHRRRKERLEARMQDAMDAFRAFEETAVAAR